MKEVIRETLTRLEIAVANDEVTLEDIAEMLAELLPMFPKEEYKNAAD